MAHSVGGGVKAPKATGRAIKEPKVARPSNDTVRVVVLESYAGGR